MPTALFYAVAAPRPPRRLLALGAATALVLLTGCAQRPASPPPVVAAQSLQDAVVTLAGSMVAHAQLPPPPASGRYPITIDPWIDATTGAQVATTQLMQSEIETLAPQHFPQLELLPFNQASLTRQPLVLLGAIEPVEAPGSVTPVQGEPGAYRIYGVLADLKTGRIAASESAWVKPQDVNLSPTAFYRDSPVALGDDTAASYLRTSESRTGAPIDPAYLQNLQAEALLADAAELYNAQDYRSALVLYRQADALPQGSHQLRIYNGLYLTTAALGDRPAATDAFSQLIGYGLQQRRLAVKFLFQPGSTAFWRDPAISGAYPMWLHEIALRTAEVRTACGLSATPAHPARRNTTISYRFPERNGFART